MEGDAPKVELSKVWYISYYFAKLSRTVMPVIDFSNKMLVTEGIPTIEDMETQALSEKYAPINRLSNLLLTLLIVLLVSTLYWQSLIQLPETTLFILPYLIWGVGILGLLQVLYSSYADLRKTYALRELDLNYCSGLFFRKTVSQPITRIQHIELKRGPIERQVGLATLQVFSAGGATHTFEIPGLPVDMAKRRRHFILQHKDIAKHV
jgi:membrane protein YdbS with pleckstrin-like domain